MDRKDTLHTQAHHDAYIPLAERLRPQHIDDVVGQERILALGNDQNNNQNNESKNERGMKGSLRICIEAQNFPSMILWGPPGTGKTTIARLLSAYIPNCEFINISAVSSGVADIKKICTDAKERQAMHIVSCVFIDEIHRFNKSQQDALLHYVEEGTIFLIGATTENPSFEINAALLSRVRVFVLEPLSFSSLEVIFKKAEAMLDHEFDMEEGVLDSLFELAKGDARVFLNIIEQLYAYQQDHKDTLTIEHLKSLDIYTPAVYDKNGDQHYNIISALHKSVRGSDCDAALYWLARMLEGGEDPRYIARRMLRMAYEDIGLTDTQVASYVLHAWETYERLGSPEGEVALAAAVIYLALSPKSNSAYEAYTASRIAAARTTQHAPPKHILNAPTGMMKDMGYGKGYVYDHDTKHAFSGQHYFPDDMDRQSYYMPCERGFEREMKKRLEYFSRMRKHMGKES